MLLPVTPVIQQFFSPSNCKWFWYFISFKIKPGETRYERWGLKKEFIHTFYFTLFQNYYQYGSKTQFSTFHSDLYSQLRGGGGTLLLLIKKIWARHSRRIFDDNHLNSQDWMCLHGKLKKTAAEHFTEQSIPPITAIFRQILIFSGISDTILMIMI